MAAGNEALPFISEWQPFSARENRIHEVAIVLMFLALLLARLRLGLGKAGLLAFAFHMLLTHVRFFYVLFLVSPLAFTREMSLTFPRFNYERWKVEPRDRIEKALTDYAAKGMIAIVAAIVLAVLLISALADLKPRDQQSIEDAIGFARTSHLTGNVLNSYNFGGPLIFHGIRTFIDGRADQIFQNGFITSVADTQKLGNEKLLEGQLEKYRIEWTMLAADDPRPIMLDRMAGWKRVYQNELAIIHVRSGISDVPVAP